MYLRIAVLIFASWLPAASMSSVLPIIHNPRILSCKSLNGVACSDSVQYGSDGTVLIEQTTVGAPHPVMDTKLETYGIHCYYGSNLPPTKPFERCAWGPGSTADHSPRVISECRLQDRSSWDLTPTSSCATATTWGHHTGAGPGGECVMFAQAGQRTGPTLVTPIGVVDATTAANSGNAFCQKPLPPNTPCDVQLPPVIDHGVMPPSGQSSVHVDGTIACGDNPVISIVGGNSVTVAPGIKTVLAPRVTRDTIRVRSDLTTSGAAPGVQQVSVVLVVSPN